MTAQQTGYDYGAVRLSALCRALGLEGATNDLLEIFRTTLGDWGDRPLEATPRWCSDVTDDGTPFEFSVAFGGGSPDLRFLLEAQGREPSLVSCWDAGRELAALLEQRYGADLSRLRLIEPLFAPEASDSAFAAWYAVCYRKGHPFDFKIYLSPQAKGKAHARTTVEEALRRLGFSNAWNLFAEIAQRRGPERDELTYLSIDLAPHREARVKLYTAHHEATFEELEAVLSAAPCELKQMRHFYETSVGGAACIGRPPSTTLAFVEGAAAPAEGTLHVPIRAYVPHDGVARDRIRALLAEQQLDVDAYDRALAAFTVRPLEAGVGMHTYVSFCAHHRGSRLTVYLAPEAYRVMPAR